MKALTQKQKIAAVIISAVLLLAVIAVSVFAYIGSDNAYDPESEEYFNSKSVNQLIDIIKTRYNGYGDINIACAAVLNEKIDEGDLVRIKKEIFDPESPDSIKILLLDTCADKKFVLDHDAVTELMFDKTQSSALRRRAFDYCVEFGEDYKEEIKTLAAGDDADLTYRAIKMYHYLWQEEGLELSIDIIKKSSDKFTDQLQAAVENCSTEVQLNYSKDNCLKFISFCEKLLTEKGMEKDETAKGFIIEAIAGIESKDALDYLIKAQYLPDDEKSRIVYQDRELLIKTAGEPASDENIGLLSECLAFCDLPEIAEALKNNIKDNEEYYNNNPEQLKIMQELAEKMTSDGEALTTESIE